jgi:hypothetical protein
MTWFPLLVLSLLQGLAIGHGGRIPFLYDLAAYTRFLVAIPLLILGKVVSYRIDVASWLSLLKSMITFVVNIP